MDTLLRGVGFITGGGSGIGEATARSLAKHGVRQLAIADIDLPAAHATAKGIVSAFPGAEAIPLQVDATNEASVNHAVTEAINKFGRIDYAVNSAGIAGSLAKSADLSVEDWSRVMDVNLKGVWMSSRAEIQAMLQQNKITDSPRYNRGVIVNVASMYGILAPPSNIPAVAYTASKHGVVGLTKVDAIVYAQKDIRINAICPGYVATPLLGPTDTDTMQKETAKIPLGRLAEADEIADHITFLVSPMSSYMHGAAVVVDGGFTIQ